MSWKAKIALSLFTLLVLLVVFVVLFLNCVPFQATAMYGFDVNDADRHGWTPLHCEAAVGRLEMVEYMVGKGADLNTRNLRGETAYNLASLYGQNRTAEYLKQLGADTSAPRFPDLRGPYMGQKPPGDTPEMFLPGVISGHNRTHSAVVFSPDGTEAYWSEGVAVTFGMVALRALGSVRKMQVVDGRWCYPELTNMMADPSFSPDGNRLFYYTFEPVREGGGWDKENYWYMDRTDSGWTEPTPVGDAVNALVIHWQCTADREGNLYFSLFSDSMYCSEYRDGEYRQPVNLREKFSNPTLVGCSPFISPDGDYLLFSYGDDLHVSFRRPDVTWTDRVSLGDEINGTTGVVNARVTPDGKYIFYQGAGSADEWGIYWVDAGIIDRLRREKS